MLVRIHQFLRPNGHLQITFCEVPNDCAPQYADLSLAGCRLTAEVLRDGLVSQTIEHPKGDFATVLTRNGPEVPKALTTMLRNFNLVQFTEWLKLQ